MLVKKIEIKGKYNFKDNVIWFVFYILYIRGGF